MRAHPSVEIQCTPQNSASDLFLNLRTGDTLTARLVSTSGGSALLKVRETSLKAQLPPGVHLLKGDVLALSPDGCKSGRFSFKLLSVNGQSVLPEATHTEQSLLALGIPPTARNIRLAQLLSQSGHAPTREIVDSFGKILSKVPGLPVSVSSFMAARGLMPNEEGIRLFSKPGPLLDQSGEITQNLLYYPFPFRPHDKLLRSALFVFRDKNAPEAEKQQTIIFISLQTQHLGTVQASLCAGSGGLKVDLTLSSTPVQMFFLQHLDTLQEALSQTGLPLRALHASAAPCPACASVDERPRGEIDIHV
jgi:hypothetical protein